MTLTDITLSEGVIFDDPHLINEYGAPITLNKGFQGVIDYYIDWREKEHNYVNIPRYVEPGVRRMRATIPF